jgi:aspartyl-tRNA synthetase
MRTHFCGLIDEALIGQTVTLCGWADVARDLGGLCFIDLRDHEGIVQIVAEPSDAARNANVVATAAKVGYEDCLRVTGVVRKRQSVNPKIRTGQVEVVASEIQVLNKAEPLPDRRKLGAVSRRFTESAPQSGHAAGSGSDSFCRRSK